MIRGGPDARAAGFTLIELLVGLVVLGCAATLLAAGVAGAGIVAGRTAQRETAGAEIAAAQGLLRARIEQLRATRRLDRSEPVVDIAGTRSAFIFTAPPPPGAEAGALERMRLLMTAPGDVMLFRASALSDRIELDAPSLAGWQGDRIVAGASALSIAYFGAAPPDFEPRWRDHWGERPQPPELVRIRVGFPAGDPRIWPDLVVRPAVTRNLACESDSVSTECVRPR